MSEETQSERYNPAEIELENKVDVESGERILEVPNVMQGRRGKIDMVTVHAG